MARPQHPQTEAIIEAVKLHYLQDGTGDLSDVHAKFPDVPRSTFHRIAEKARQGLEASAIREQTPAALKAAQTRIRQNVQSPETVRQRARMHLPTAPSPAVIASMSGAEAGAVFDFMGSFRRVVEDADLLRDKAFSDNPDGTKRLTNPMLLDNSIRRRLTILETYLKAMSEAYNLQKLQELYHLVIDEVGKADPGVQQAILARLRTLNDERGLTMAARVS